MTGIYCKQRRLKEFPSIKKAPFMGLFIDLLKFILRLVLPIIRRNHRYSYTFYLPAIQ